MALYRVGATGLKVLRADKTTYQLPPGQIVNFVTLPHAYEGELTPVRRDPKRGVYEQKMKRAKDDKHVPSVAEGAEWAVTLLPDED